MKRKVLSNNRQLFYNTGYRFEPAFNEIVLSCYKTTKVKLSGLDQTWKSKKVGFIRGAFLDLKNIIDFLVFFGPLTILDQMRFIKNLAYYQD